MHFLLNSSMCVGISSRGDDSSAFCLLVLHKGKDHCWLLYLSNQRFCNNNSEIKQGNWITKLHINNVTIYNGNVDEIKKHSQIKPEFAFTILSKCSRFLIHNINMIIFGHDTGVFVAKPLVRLITFDVPSSPSIFVANKRTGLLSNHLQQMTFFENWKSESPLNIFLSSLSFGMFLVRPHSSYCIMFSSNSLFINSGLLKKLSKNKVQNVPLNFSKSCITMPSPKLTSTFCFFPKCKSNSYKKLFELAPQTTI